MCWWDLVPGNPLAYLLKRFMSRSVITRQIPQATASWDE
jgi:hypothetical protein